MVISAQKTVHSLLATIVHANPNVIGIDGLDGCRKSTLAQQVAGHLHFQVIELDSFLEKNKGSFVDHLDIDGVRNAVQGRNLIIEGVCLLKVLEMVGLDLDLLIYVRRHHLGLQP